MTTIDLVSLTVAASGRADQSDEAQLAVAAFLARYSGRTLDAYRHDLRVFFQWAADLGLGVLDATRPHIELFRTALEDRGLAASTIDRRLSTVCGFYRFAHIDGRITSNPAQYVRRPRVHPTEGHGMDRAELGTFLFTAERFDCDHAALAVLLGLNGLRVSEACATNVEDLGFERAHRTLRILGKGNQPAAIPLVPRTARTIRHNGLVGSMGRVGACGDNAAMESFFSLLQKNVLDRQRWATRDELRVAITTWIERTYHRRRRQRALGRLTPIEYEILNTTARAA